jgi:NADH-quinone oxidoreductase subunit F
MPANSHEINDATDETINFMFLSAPYRILGNEKGKVAGLEIHKMHFDGFDNAGRKKPVDTGESAIVECDTIILAIGETVEFEPAKEIGLEMRKNGAVRVSQPTFKTNLPNVYAGGDAVTGPATVSEAMMKVKRFHLLFRDFKYKNEVEPEPEGGKRVDPKKLPVKERISNFQEVLAGYTGEQAMAEANRCLRCDVKCQDQD